MSKTSDITERDRITRALAADPSDPRVQPADLRLDRREGLFITWGDGAKSRFPLAFLRKNCPCATCRTERETKKETPVAVGLSLTVLPQGISRAAEFIDAKLVGRYAMQITWGDGHSTGIYDFRYLRELDSDAGS